MLKTRDEIIAYNAGVRSALAHAKRAADALAANPSWKPTRVPFAVAALDEFASAGESLLLPLPPTDPVDAPPRPHDPAPAPYQPPRAVLREPKPPIKEGSSYDETIRQLRRRITVDGQRYIPVDQFEDALRVSNTLRKMLEQRREAAHGAKIV